MRKQDTLKALSMVLIVTISLFGILPVSAQSGQLSDLTTYTVAGGGSEDVSVTGSDSYLVDNLNQSVHASIRQTMPEEDSNVKISFNLLFNSLDQGSDFAIGAYEDSGTNGDTVWQNVVGLAMVGTDVHIQTQYSRDNIGCDFGVGVTRKVVIDINEDESTVELTIYNSTSGDTVICQAERYIQSGTQYEVVSAFQSNGGGQASETLSISVNSWSVDYSAVSNDGENFLTEYHIASSESDDRDISQNWITINENDDGTKVYKNLSAKNKQVRLDYQVIYYNDTANAVQANIGFSRNNQSTQASITGSFVRKDGNNFESISTSESYWGNDIQDNNIGAGKYYATMLMLPQNASVIYRLYSDKARTNLVVNGSTAYPAASDFPVFYAAIASRTGNRISVGHYDLTVLEVADAGLNMSDGTQVGSDPQFDTSKNWVTVSGGSVSYYFNQGPATNDTALKFRVVKNAPQSYPSGTYWALTSTGDNVTGMTMADSPDRITGTIGDFSGGFSADFGPNININLDQTYYGTLIRDGDTVSVKLYSDQARENLVGTSNVTRNNMGSWDLSYLFAVRESQGTWQISLGEAANISEPPAPPFNGSITISVKQKWMDHGTEQKYTVIIDENDTDVTDQAAVTAEHPTILSIDDSANTVRATSNENISNRSYIMANVGESTDRVYITVGNRTLSNIDIMPPSQWVSSVLGVDDPDAFGGSGTWYIFGSEIQWLLLAILLGAGIGGIGRNRYIGIGAIVGLNIIFWILSFVSLGMVFVAVFTAIFMATILIEVPGSQQTTVNIDMSEDERLR